MATKKKSSQAERAASGAKKQTKPQTTGKSGEKGKAPAKERTVPVRFYSATACICTFILLLIIFFTTEGAIPGMIRNLIHGLIGVAGFIVAIPVSLYLFFIHAFSGKRPVVMRSICVGLFILLCGGISHLVLDPQGLSMDISIIKELYIGGDNGSTGGLLRRPFVPERTYHGIGWQPGSDHGRRRKCWRWLDRSPLYVCPGQGRSEYCLPDAPVSHAG